VDGYFDPESGMLAKAAQTGHVHYVEGTRQAWAESGVYTAQDANLVLTGSPRVVENGGTTTADRILMNRDSGAAEAQGRVKSTYSDLKQQPDGAMLAASDPVHVTGEQMTADRESGVAVYTGNARLWQGPSIVEAPEITFNRAQRSVLAVGDAAKPVKTVFVQSNVAGQVSPVNIIAERLDYSDPQRQAVFTHNVVSKSADGTLTADEATVFLLPKRATGTAKTPSASAGGGALASTPSQLDKIVAVGHVVVQQPTRHGQGEKLVYTAAEGKFVLSGGSPSIFDAEHGITRGVSLTFFNRDDRVVVQGERSSPTFTQTRVVK
jgi:lipopolysaccharide export system protein LptA